MRGLSVFVYIYICVNAYKKHENTYDNLVTII